MCVELYLNSPNTPPWRGAQLKHRDRFAFNIYSELCATTETRRILLQSRSCKLRNGCRIQFERTSSEGVSVRGSGGYPRGSRCWRAITRSRLHHTGDSIGHLQNVKGLELSNTHSHPKENQHRDAHELMKHQVFHLRRIVYPTLFRFVS